MTKKKFTYEILRRYAFGNQARITVKNSAETFDSQIDAFCAIVVSANNKASKLTSIYNNNPAFTTGVSDNKLVVFPNSLSINNWHSMYVIKKA